MLVCMYEVAMLESRPEFQMRNYQRNQVPFLAGQDRDIEIKCWSVFKPEVLSFPYNPTYVCLSFYKYCKTRDFLTAT